MKKLYIVLAGTMSLIYATNSNEITSRGLIQVAAEFEGFNPTAYHVKLSNGKYEDFQTIGYGHRIMQRESAQLADKTLFHDDALQLLAHDFRTRANIDSYLRGKVSVNEYEAMRCFCFNVGQGNFAQSDLLKTVNDKNADSTDAYEFFGHWRKAGGDISRGLIKRRFVELFIFAGKSLDPSDDSSPSDQWGLDELSITDANWGKIDYNLRKQAVDIYKLYSAE